MTRSIGIEDGRAPLDAAGRVSFSHFRFLTALIPGNDPTSYEEKGGDAKIAHSAFRCGIRSN